MWRDATQWHYKLLEIGLWWVVKEWIGPVFLSQRMLTSAPSVLGRIFIWLLRVWPKIRSLAPSSTPNSHVIANCVFRDVVHRIYQGVHFQIVIRLQDTRLNALPCPDFQETHTGWDRMTLNSLMPNFTDTSYGQKFIYAQKVKCNLLWQSQNKFLWTSRVPNFIEIRRKMQQLWAKFNVHGSVLRKNILIYIQQDATLHSLFYLETTLHVSGQRQVAVTVWQIPDAVDTFVCAPDVGWWYHPKHVEQFLNKINCVTLHLVGSIFEYGQNVIDTLK